MSTFLNKIKQVKKIKFILFVLVVLISFSFTNSVFGWTAPTAVPPNSNAPTPLNVSSTGQTKTGALTVGDFYLSGGGNEGNISNLSHIKGYNDLFIWGNAAQTAPIYLSGSVIELYTGSTKRLEIDGSGNLIIDTSTLYANATNNRVGIATTTPAYTLDVAGDINLTGALTIDGSPITQSYWTQNGTDLYYNTGSVGIGTASPDANYKLSLSGGGIKSESTSNPAGYFSSSTGYGLLVNSGNVGIWTTAPGAGLHVADPSSGPVAIFDTDTSTQNFYVTRLGGVTQALSVGVDDHTAYISSVQDEDLAGYGNMILRLGNSVNQTPNFIISDYRSGSDVTRFQIDMENGNVSLVGKLTVPTIDPQYDINGNTYGYYISDYAGGVRMNVTGKAELEGFIYTIDFDNLEEGSELWMFAQKTDLGEEMEKLIILLTPEGKKASLWYEIVYSENQLIVHGDKDVKFSYRLSAPRYDWQDHPVLIGPAD